MYKWEPPLPPALFRAARPGVEECLLEAMPETAYPVLPVHQLLQMLGTEKLRSKKIEQEPQGQRREEGQNTIVGEKEDEKRKGSKRGLGRPFSFKVNTKLISKKILCISGPTSQILISFLYVY